MQKNLNVRASDNIDDSDLEKSGFVTRQDTPLRKICRLIFFIVVIAVSTKIIVDFEAMNVSIMCTTVGTVMFFLARELERQKKVQQSTEFMNALFASVLSAGYSFCIAVRHDGKIVYFSRAFQELFPTFLAEPKRSLDVLLASQNLPANVQESILAAVTAGNAKAIPVTLQTGADNISQNMTLQIDPIERPAGFVLIRGK